MKFKKGIALCLAVIILLSLSGCKKQNEPKNFYAMFGEVSDTGLFNTVLDLTFTTLEKNTENDNSASSYKIYLDADTDTNSDIGRLYIKHSINGEPYKYLGQYVRSHNFVYYNLDNYINYNILVNNYKISSIESFKANTDINAEHALLDLSKLTTLNSDFDNIEINITSSVKVLLDAYGEDLFGFLIKEKLLTKNNETTFSEINLTITDLITVVDYLADAYSCNNGIKEKMVEIANSLPDSQLKNDIVGENPAIITYIELFFDNWTKCSKEERLVILLGENIEDFTINIVADTSDPNILTFKICGTYFTDIEETRFEGTLKFRKSQSFNIDIPEEYVESSEVKKALSTTSDISDTQIIDDEIDTEILDKLLEKYDKQN